MLDAFLTATCSGFVLQTAASAPGAECCHTSYAKALGWGEGSIVCLAVLISVGPRLFTAIPKCHLVENKLGGMAALLGLLPAQDWDQLRQCMQTWEPRNFPRSHSWGLELVFLQTWWFQARCSMYLPSPRVPRCWFLCFHVVRVVLIGVPLCPGGKKGGMRRQV